MCKATAKPSRLVWLAYTSHECYCVPCVCVARLSKIIKVLTKLMIKYYVFDYLYIDYILSNNHYIDYVLTNMYIIII